MNLLKKLFLLCFIMPISIVAFSKDNFITPIGFQTEYSTLFEYEGNFMNTSILFKAGNKIYFKTSFGIGYRNKPLRSENGVDCHSFVNFNLSPIITPIKTKWVELNFSVGPTISHYTSNKAIAWGNWFSPDPEIVLQQIRSDYMWRIGIETGADLSFVISKDISVGVKMGYISYLDKENRYNMNDFFTYGVNLNYYFNRNVK
ncbi:MAG: hypothetical protein PF541_05180 [Prolixibacteraceae bacterium]|jgi:hypothetical protein|nr:hypothetical protein [Prolixibacteraceae bacterium]